MIYNKALDDFEVMNAVAVNTNFTATWSNYGNISPVNRIQTGRKVRIMLAVGNPAPEQDYDISLVRIVISYKGLA
jgi:hypothetical protein